MKFVFFLMLVTCSTFSRPLVVAHRGASREAPENTICAFELAWSQSADAIEGDFHLTKDLKIVCIHDNDTEAIATEKLIVKESTFKQLQALTLSEGFLRGFRDQSIPSFSEVAHTVPTDGKFYIEIKSDSEILPHLERALKLSKLRTDQIVVISFNQKVISDLKRTTPELKAAWLTKLKQNESGEFEPSTAELISQLTQCKADGVSVQFHNDLSESYINRIKEAGFEFHVWTVDDPKQAKQLANLGVDSITTNCPELILKTLQCED